MKYYRCSECGKICVYKINNNDQINPTGCESKFIEIEKKYFNLKYRSLKIESIMSSYMDRVFKKKKTKKRLRKKNLSWIKKNNNYPNAVRLITHFRPEFSRIRQSNLKINLTHKMYFTKDQYLQSRKLIDN